jgi:DNA-binding transcriptional regulator WhiA
MDGNMVNHTNVANLYGANTRRARGAGRQRAHQARLALQIIDAHQPRNGVEDGLQRRHRRVLLTRITDSDASLAQLATSIGLNKDEYAGRLRRAFDYADSLAENIR